MTLRTTLEGESEPAWLYFNFPTLLMDSDVVIKTESGTTARMAVGRVAWRNATDKMLAAKNTVPASRCIILEVRRGERGGVMGWMTVWRVRVCA